MTEIWERSSHAAGSRSCASRLDLGKSPKVENSLSFDVQSRGTICPFLGILLIFLRKLS